jgi:hypothetical protein
MCCCVGRPEFAGEHWQQHNCVIALYIVALTGMHIWPLLVSLLDGCLGTHRWWFECGPPLWLPSLDNLVIDY